MVGGAYGCTGNERAYLSHGGGEKNQEPLLFAQVRPYAVLIGQSRDQ